METKTLYEIHLELAKTLAKLRFAAPVAYIYNPIEYASNPLKRYLEQYGQSSPEVVLLGMNPGPFGMAQTGVPFGDAEMVRDWLGIQCQVGKPPREHPKRLVKGFECTRKEVSGQRLWGWAKKRYGTPESFFKKFFVLNYCPLVFMEASSRNRTPDKLPAAEKRALFEACDHALRECVRILNPSCIVGIGAFAEQRAVEALADDFSQIRTGRILHPSPASPIANRGWAEAAEKMLLDLDIDL